MPKLTEDQQLEWNVQAWENYDAMVGKGGLAEKMSASERLQLEIETIRNYGPRPEFKSAAEIVAEEATEGRADDDPVRKHEEKRAFAEWWQKEAAPALEAQNAETLAQMGYDSTDAMHKRERQPIPSLITNDEGVRGYMAEDGRVVPEYIVISNKPAFNPEFTKIHEHAERLKKLAGI